MNFLRDGEAGLGTVLLAHGAGAPMDSAAMTMAAKALAEAGFAVVRFEFAYMAAQREGQRKPPPRAERLMDEYRAAVAALGACQRPLIVGGKSMGGRVASMVADGLRAAGRADALLCLGYPFHPPGKPEQLRTAHLETLETPALIAQGTRDIFGTREEVVGYRLSPSVEILWLEDGDHDLKPRKAISGFTAAGHVAAMAQAAAAFAAGLNPPPGKPPRASCG